MSLGRRLWNVARAEVRDAFRRKPAGAEPSPEARDSPQEAEDARDAASDDEPRAEPRRARSPARASEADVRRWYANLELPYGSSAEEVRAAYRRMMRRYHPDRHFGDAEAQRVATELAQALRRAYEGLLAHLS